MAVHFAISGHENWKMWILIWSVHSSRVRWWGHWITLLLLRRDSQHVLKKCIGVWRALGCGFLASFLVFQVVGIGSQLRLYFLSICELNESFLRFISSYCLTEGRVWGDSCNNLACCKSVGCGGNPYSISYVLIVNYFFNIICHIKRHQISSIVKYLYRFIFYWDFQKFIKTSWNMEFDFETKFSWYLKECC